MDHTHDLAFIYLVSHGSREAELQTGLPTYDNLSPISAASVADALSQAGIKRRVIIVSACFSGSRIPTLANDDTIVITAARKDRTSFGCEDSLALTYFGGAFLHGPLARGASLRDSFDASRKAIVAVRVRIISRHLSGRCSLVEACRNSGSNRAELKPSEDASDRSTPAIREAKIQKYSMIGRAKDALPARNIEPLPSWCLRRSLRRQEANDSRQMAEQRADLRFGIGHHMLRKSFYDLHWALSYLRS